MNQRYIVFLLLISCSVTFSCKKKSDSNWLNFIPIGEEIELIEELASMTNPCRDAENYIPDPDHPKHTSYKRVKVNFHIIRNAEGKGNLSEKVGRKYVQEVLISANEGLSENSKMRLPAGNDTEVLSARYKYELWPTSYIPNDDGIYFHNDDEHYFNINRGKKKNIFKRDVYEKYGIQKDSVLNVFVQDVHLDSIASKSFTARANGVAFSTWVKVALWHEALRDTVYQNGKAVVPGKYNPPKLLNHEIGHVFGLAHAWGRDNCEDTPEHPNCWALTGVPPCHEISNNIMDYNAHMSALTPCQIGRVHKSILTNPIKRALVIKDWCKLNPYKNFNIKEEITWNSCKTVQGNIIIENGGRLVIRCKTSMPNGSEIVVHPQGELVLQGAHLYNDCDGQWNGIKVLSEGKVSGKVSYIGKATVIEHSKNNIQLEKEPEIKS